jgi:hypothetical protein
MWRLDDGRCGGPGGVDKVQLSVRCELHGALGMLLGVKVEAEGVSMKLSTAARCCAGENLFSISFNSQNFFQTSKIRRNL